MSCCKCHKEIYDRVYLYADNRHWHFECLTCEKCLNLLANTGTKCYFKDGMILCRNDYVRMKMPVCAACQQFVKPDSYVHKIPCPNMNSINNNFNEYSDLLIYHPSCLSCFKCQNFLRKGDKYILKPDNMGIVCMTCANADFTISPINSSINQTAPAPTQRKRGRQSNSVKVKAEKNSKSI